MVIADSDEKKIRYRQELRLFLFLTVVLAPALSAMIIGAYGFAVWFGQIMSGS